jgi:DNA-binding IclR family transcriptional regulator
MDDEFDEFDEFGEAAPGDDVLQVVERSEGITTRGVAAAVGMPEERAEDVLEDLLASGEVERDADGEWIVPEQAGADDPYVF